VSQYEKGKINLDFTEARDSDWQWHQLGHMQVCTSPQTDNHTSTPPVSFLQAGCSSCRPTNSVEALTAKHASCFKVVDDVVVDGEDGEERYEMIQSGGRSATTTSGGTAAAAAAAAVSVQFLVGAESLVQHRVILRREDTLLQHSSTTDEQHCQSADDCRPPQTEDTA